MSWATDLLEVSATASVSELKEAYHRRLLELHPDTGGEQVDPTQITRLKEAYELLLAAASEQPCPSCRGRGVLVVQRGWSTVRVPCPDCGGTGWPVGI